jgi:endonuclease G
MDFGQVFNDDALRQEFLDKYSDLANQAAASGALERVTVGYELVGGGFESFGGGFEGGDSSGGLLPGEAIETTDSMMEGRYRPGSQPGFEAIVERFTRPVYLVQESKFTVPPDNFDDSEEIKARLATGRDALEGLIPSVGRIDLRNHRLDWVGTGWLVGPGIVVTNRHVAAEFATRRDGGFDFRRFYGNPKVSAHVDWRHEYRQGTESRFQVKEVLWIEPEDSVDMAIVRVSDSGDSDESLPPAIELMTSEELRSAGVGAWVAVIGYPAYDSRNNAADQQRIFDGIYNVKRLAPGQVTAIEKQDVLHHDATTLGGNSGSAVIDLASGKAAALHFGGIQGERNDAVQAPRIREILDQHAS